MTSDVGKPQRSLATLHHGNEFRMVLIGGITANCCEQFRQYRRRDKHDKRKGGKNDNIPHT
jgi:hypothetical protein